MAAQYSFFRTGSPSQVYFQTTGLRVYFRTGTSGYNFFQTPAGGQFYFRTSSPDFLFFRTPAEGRSTELILKPSYNAPGSVAADFASVNIVDATGDYPIDPTGYTPSSGTSEPTRPKRTEVQLWIALRNYTEDWQSPILLAPDTQNNVTPNFTYIFEDVEDGVYDIMMIGAPVSEDWNDWKDRSDLIEYAQTNWFVGSVGLAKIGNSSEAYATTRYNYVKGVLIGKPRPTNITALATRINALYAAVQVQDWEAADAIVDDLNTFVANLPLNGMGNM
jgi:hypothetical protein